MVDKKENNPIELAFCVDDNFAIHLCILLQSIKHHLAQGVSVNCNILGDLSKASQSKLNELSSTTFHLTYNGDIKGLEEFRISERYQDRLSTITYYRLMLPKILYEKSKVIYLDADMLVLDDLTKLWKINLHGLSTAVVEDFNLQKDKRYSFLELKFNRYFNAGLLVMDLDVWRKNDLTNKAIANMKVNLDYEYNDQDGLNVVLDGHCCYLDEVWNAQTPVLSKSDCNITPKIIHFTGQEKPWHVSSSHPNTKDYLFYKKQTSYADTALDYFLDSEDLILLKQLTEQFPSGCRLAIHGCGNRGRRIIDHIVDKLTSYEIQFIVDKNAVKTYRNIQIHTKYPNKKIEALLIASIPFREEIIEYLPESIIENKVRII